ncbi:unnamed protein product [Somion occarium]|uniref:RRM domain-containing protein n=1 Tax=Somion occarium TaxID=3059160 RepID=A0ABP1CXH7_9APHY
MTGIPPLGPSEPSTSRRTSFTTSPRPPHLPNPLSNALANLSLANINNNNNLTTNPLNNNLNNHSRPGTSTSSLSRPGTSGLGSSPILANLVNQPFGSRSGSGGSSVAGSATGGGSAGLVTGQGQGTNTGTPTNDDIEAVIQMATSARSGSSNATNPPRDTRTQLFVGNLPYRVRWQDLKDLFRRAGTVLRADVSLGPDNRSRGYGTVLLATAEDAGRAVDMFNGFEWMTRVLEVRPDRMGALVAGEEGPGSLNGAVAAGSAGVGAGASSGSGGVGGTGTGTGTGTPLNNGIAFAASNVSSPFPSASATPFPGSAGTLNLTASAAAAASRLAGLGTGGATSPFASDFGVGGSVGGEEDANSLAGRSLFVGNLPFHIQWQDLKDLFRMSGGTILRADVALGPDGRSRGFGMVSFATEVDAERARAMFNGYEYSGRVLKVHFDKYAGSGIGLGPSMPPIPNLSTSSTPAPSSSSIPSPLSLSTPHSPSNAHAGYAIGSTAQQSGVSFAQQVMLSQHEQQLQYLHSLSHSHGQGRVELSRYNSDSLTYRYGLGEDSLQGSSAGTTSSPTYAQNAEYLQYLQHLQSYGSSSSSAVGTSQYLPPTGASTSTQRNSPLYATLDRVREEEKSPFEFGGFGPDGTRIIPGSQRGGFGSAVGASGLSRAVEAEVMQPGSVLDLSGRKERQGDVNDNRENMTSEEGMRKTKGKQTQLYSSSPGSSQQASSSASLSVESKNLTSPTQSYSSAATTNQASSHTNTTPNHHHHHPAHPGPISLPPPPPINTFPVPPPHTLSPYHYPPHPMSSPYMSPLYHPAMMNMGMPGLTPHGLPPITPSMPSFTFLPQPNPMGGMVPAYMPASSTSLGGDHLEMPTSDERKGGNEGDGEGEGEGEGEGNNGNGSGGGSNTASTMTDSRVRPPALPQIPSHHNPHQQQPPGYPYHHHPQVFSPYTPFSPGLTMSPGAFWGRPGTGTGANPYINPAVGAPVHPQQPHPHPMTPHHHVPPFYAAMRQPPVSEEIGYFPPVPPMQYTQYMQGQAQQQEREREQQEQQQQQQQTYNGEEPQSYFPFVPPSAVPSRPSGLSQEISAGSSHSGEGGSGSARAGISGSNSDPSVHGAQTESVVSSGTNTGTGTNSVASPTRPGSSMGTSWTDSPEPPSQGFEALIVGDRCHKEDFLADSPAGELKGPSQESTVSSGGPSLSRAESDPMVRQPGMVISPVAEDLQGEGERTRESGVDVQRSSSDPQTSWSRAV